MRNWKSFVNGLGEVGILCLNNLWKILVLTHVCLHSLVCKFVKQCFYSWTCDRGKSILDPGIRNRPIYPYEQVMISLRTMLVTSNLFFFMLRMFKYPFNAVDNCMWRSQVYVVSTSFDLNILRNTRKYLNL